MSEASNEIEYESVPQNKPKSEKKKPTEESESNYDDEYDDTLPDENANSVDVESVSLLSR